MKKIAILLIYSVLLLNGCANKTSTSTTSTAKDITGRKDPRRAQILFLGHNSKHHDSNKYAPWLAISLFKSGINLTYTTSLDDLNAENLSKYDGLVIYANYDTLASAQ